MVRNTEKDGSDTMLEILSRQFNRYFLFVLNENVYVSNYKCWTIESKYFFITLLTPLYIPQIKAWHMFTYLIKCLIYGFSNFNS